MSQEQSKEIEIWEFANRANIPIVQLSSFCLWKHIFVAQRDMSAFAGIERIQESTGMKYRSIKVSQRHADM
jgi:hypothetical protein